MPKMRAVKPEMWTDEKFVELSPYARLLFIGMWNFACDNGHLDDSPKQLKMRVLPADDVDASALLDELVTHGLVERGDGWVKVTKLAEHQRPDLRFLVLCDHCANDEHTTYSPGDRKERTTRARSAHTGRTESAPRAPHEHTTGARRNGDVDGDGDGDRAPQAAPTPRTRGSRIPDDFAVTTAMTEWAKDNGFDVDLAAITDEFFDYWHGVPGAKGVKLDWEATWRNWVRRKAADGPRRLQPVRDPYAHLPQPKNWSRM